MKQFLISLAVAALLASCSSDKPAPTAAPAPAAPTTAAQAMPSLPSVPLELLEKIWQEGTQVDYIFYNYPFTMSLPDKASIQYAVRHIAEGTTTRKPECKPAGRVTYQINGNIVLEGDFYFSTGCTYFVFEKNREKVYANYMTDDGIQYFNSQIQQAMKMQQDLEKKAAGGGQ